MPSSIVKYSGPITVDFTVLTGKGVRIGIIDSGICTKRFEYKTACIVKDKKVVEATKESIQDTIGHGTACAGIVKKIAPDAELYVAKVFHDELSASVGSLVAAIEWLIESNVNIINLSLGTTRRGRQLESLKEVCDRAEKEGIIVISANCNEPNKIAFPAAFPNVLGVDSGKISGIREFFIREDSPIDIVAKGDREIVQWVKPDKVFMGGASFACPKITGLAACIYEMFPAISIQELKSVLQKNSIEQEPELYYDDSLMTTGKYKVEIMEETEERPLRIGKPFVDQIKKAVIYPFNKEMHSLVRFRHTLSYEISGVVDFLGKRTVGKDPAEVIGAPKSDLKVAASLEVELEKADTLILGYVDELERITKKKIFEKCIRTAVEMKKNIYSLVPLNRNDHKEVIELLEKQNDVWFYSPVVDMEMFEQLTRKFNPEEHSEKPIIGVFGTSSQQGKFTCQLALKEQFVKMGYKVGHLSTEHQGELCGADVVFPSGYSAQTNLMLPLELHIPFVRSAVRMIEAQGVHITISGGQSGIIPFGYGGDFNAVGSLPSLAMLMGLLPDAVILAVNTMDTDEFIEQCIQSVEALGKGKVVGLVFSDKKKFLMETIGNQQVAIAAMSVEEMENMKVRLEKRFGLACAVATGVEGIKKIADVVESYMEVV